LPVAAGAPLLVVAGALLLVAASTPLLVVVGTPLLAATDTAPTMDGWPVIAGLITSSSIFNAGGAYVDVASSGTLKERPAPG
jgi:hypothetical protein